MNKTKIIQNYFKINKSVIDIKLYPIDRGRFMVEWIHSSC